MVGGKAISLHPTWWVRQAKLTARQNKTAYVEEVLSRLL